MTFQKNHLRRQEVLSFYMNYAKKNQALPTLQQCAIHLNVSRAVVKHYVDTFEREGQFRGVLKLAKIDQRKNMSADTNLKKAAGGRAGALKLKKMAFDAGVQFNAFARIPGQDEVDIEERIDKIVKKARKAGTLFRPQYVSMHNARKVG